MPIFYGPLPPIPTGMTVGEFEILRENMSEDTIQTLMRMVYAQIASRQGNFNVMSFGAVGIGDMADDTAAFEAVVAAAEAATTSTFAPCIYIPDGDYRISRPIRLNSRLSILGQSREGTVIQWRSGYVGHTFTAIDDRDIFTQCAPRYTTAYGGNALLSELDGDDTDTRWFFDLTQYDQCRLSGDLWTLRFDRAFDSTDGDLLYAGAYVGVPSWSDDLPHALELFFSLDVLKIRFRHGNTYDVQTISTAAHPGGGSFSTGTMYNFEISWDKANGKLRVFVDGQLWSNGSYSPPTGDGSGFLHHPWERMTLGAGSAGSFPSEDVVFAYINGATKDFALSSRVEHTADFTPAAYIVDTRCLLSLKFRPEDRYKGMAIGTGYAGTTTVYLYPTCFRSEEHNGLRIENMRLTGGLGIRFEFASDSLIRNVLHFAPGDGWTMGGNGYFSNFAYCDVVASGGRIGMGFGSLSYGSIIGCISSGAIPFASSAANIQMIGCTATVQGPTLTGFLMGAGTFGLMLCQVDSENPVTGGGYVAPAIFFDCLGGIVQNCTFYPPLTGDTIASAVLIYNSSTSTKYKFDSCNLAPSLGEPVFVVVEKVALERPVICNSPLNPNDEELCADASKVVDIDAYVLALIG